MPLDFPLMLLTEGAGTCLLKCIMPGSQIQSHVSRTQLHKLWGGRVATERDISSPAGISL